MLRLKTFYMFFILLFGVPQALSQDLPKASADPCANPQNITQWVNCRVDVIAAAQINQKGTSKQVEVPSIGDSTTSLVDQTDAPDLFGLALNLAGINNDDGTSNEPVPVISTTAFALYAATKGHDPLDPAFYLRHVGLRRLSFSLGQDSEEDGATTSAKKALLFGVKYLILNKRDASSVSNRSDLKKVSAALRDATVDFAAIEDDVEVYIYRHLKGSLGYPRVAEAEDDAMIRFVNDELSSSAKMAATLQLLTIAQQDEINQMIANKIGAAVRLRETSFEAFEKIRRRPQLSFSFQTKQRQEGGANEYRSGLLLDFGIYQRLNLAVNATFDYEDSKVVGGDKRGGRVAGEGYFHLNGERNIFSGKDPIILSFGGESKWMSSSGATHTGQVKLTFPIFDGLELPISFSVANRSELIKESKVRGRFGFTLDLAKLMKGLR